MQPPDSSQQTSAPLPFGEQFSCWDEGTLFLCGAGADKVDVAKEQMAAKMNVFQSIFEVMSKFLEVDKDIDEIG